MIFYEYKGHLIYPFPRYASESGCWRVEVAIRRDNRIEVFSNGQLLSTKGEAVFTCIDYGKKLIDEGKVHEAMLLADEDEPEHPGRAAG